ncbi:hypothetical protein DSM14862_04417 (plasmid) [Sulfitobacter indolifex]|jgi:hypothetical protein|uniref:YtkA-like n=2 Tax=Roseobacteraceae TaxID=2854170 RepID=A0A1H9GSP1_9RHOB|nr:FixH family protein [Chachezhania antarctica]KMK64264.1 YtkA [Puniceibacterium sp. IMCC21224]UOA21577.1 hypothetical protein DSM14862_04417 [Sulfitobacter indolifex]SEQ53008.1 YtkA-like [Thalassovita taeanensis]
MAGVPVARQNRRIMLRYIPTFLATLVVATQLSVPIAQAAASDYNLVLVETTYPFGDGAVLELRLIDTRTNAPVEGAVIFATRLDMEPDGMETMTSTVLALPGEEPGLYRFSADLTMDGNWRFSVAAKVQGEPETVQAQIVLEVLP